jgi:hypothetical protein
MHRSTEASTRSTYSTRPPTRPSPAFSIKDSTRGLLARTAVLCTGTAPTLYGDQYAICDREWGDIAVKDLHHKLYAQSYPHSGDVFYVLVCRVILGHQVQTDSNLAVQPGVFAGSDGANRRQLAVIPGSKPPTPYHSLLGTHYPRFREFVSFNSTYIYPEYLVAYHRVPPSTRTTPASPLQAPRLRPPPPRSTAAATGGANTAPLLQKPNLGLLPVSPQSSSGLGSGWSWWAKLLGVVLLVAVVAVVVVVESGGSHSQPVTPAGPPTLLPSLDDDFVPTPTPMPPAPTPMPPMPTPMPLAPADLAAWQDLYDSTNGPRWSHCSDSKSDPCSCSDGSFVTCTGGHITQM